MIHNLDFEKHGFRRNNAGDEQVLFRPLRESNCGNYTFEVDTNTNMPANWILNFEDFSGKETELWRGNLPDQDVLDLIVEKKIYKTVKIAIDHDTDEEA
jgi:hypothetical protein